MLNPRHLLAAVVVSAFVAQSALATPVIDGVVNVGEYDFFVQDTPNEVAMDYFNTGLDIDTVYFDEDANWYSLAVTVVAPPLDTDGEPTSFLGETIFIAMLVDDGSSGNDPHPAYLLGVDMSGTSVEVELEQFVGGTWQDVPLNDPDYDVAVGDALELRISADLLANLPEDALCQAQLDGTGMGQDDQVQGIIVPEPGALALLGLGTIGLLLRRRRTA